MDKNKQTFLYAAQKLVDQPAGLAQFYLKGVQTTGTKYLNINEVLNKTVAAPHSKGGVADLVTFQNKKGENFYVPEIALKTAITSHNKDTQILNHIYESSDDLVRDAINFTAKLKAINIRKDIMTVEALTTGRVLDSRGNVIYDYERDPDLVRTASWSTTDNPLTNINDLVNALANKGMSKNDVVVMLGSGADAILMNNAAFNDKMDNRTMANGNLVIGTNEMGVDKLYRVFSGQGWYTFAKYNHVKDDAGDPIVPENAVIVSSMSNQGIRWHGGIDISDPNGGGMITYTGEEVIDRYVTKDPDGVMDRVQTRFFPLVNNINQFGMITVT